MINLDYKMQMVSSAGGIEAELMKDVINFVKKKYGESIEDKANHLATKAQEIVRKKIENNKTYQDLLSGQLLHELGLPMKIRIWVATGMLDAIVSGITAEIVPVSIIEPLSFDIKLNWDNSIVLQTGFAQYVSVGKNGKPHSVDWLDWLLEGGHNELVTGYHIVYDDSFVGSRTGGVLMKEGGGWNIPRQYVGFPFDNFITRSIAESIPEILEAVV